MSGEKSLQLTPTLSPELKGSEPSDEMLTKDEIATRLKVSVRTIEQWQHDGCVPYLKISTVILFYWPMVVKHLVENFTVLRSLQTATDSNANGGGR